MVPSFGLPATEIMRTHCRAKLFGKFYIKYICVIWSDELFVFIICNYYVHMIPVQSNQKMHDLYATTHISQMVLPDAFWAVCSQIFS